MSDNNIPRPEYPRPEAKRDAWLNLNGTWQFGFDPNHEGILQNWQIDLSHLTETIQVPFVFQSKLSGINRQDFIDTVWYARKFILPPEYEKKTVLLHFGAVDYETTVFVNGGLVGIHSGGITPFKFDITPFLTSNRDQTIVVKVWDPPFDPSIPRGKQTTKTYLDSCSYEKSLGIWQTVWLEFVNDCYLSRSDYYIRPNLETGVLEANITVEGKLNPDLVIEAELFDGEKSLSTIGFTVLETSLFGQIGEMRVKFNPKEIELWDIDHPKLYEMHFRLIDGETDDDDLAVYDELICTFGFREIGFESNKFHLNHKPIYLRQALYQGYWTEGLWTAPSDALLKKELELTLEMGYNSLRLHQIVADPRLLYWADKMGILLWGEISNTFGSDARAKDNHMKEWTNVVRRDRNHPSIVTWTPINESWGTGSLAREDNLQYLRSLYYWTKTMDPTRPVNTNDGWENPDTSDIIAIHDYCFAPDFAARMPIEKPDYPEFFKDYQPSRRTFIKGVKITEKPVMITEWGGWGMYAQDPTRKPDRREAWGYQGILYQSFDEVLDLYEAFIDELVKRKDWISGHCYTEFNDQYQEVNGMLTFDRHPKGDLVRLKAINLKLNYDEL